jgi:hypothetical protein
MRRFERGDAVIVGGLERDTWFNGARGTVLGGASKTGRYAVRVAPAVVLNVRPERLDAYACYVCLDADADGGADGGALVRTGCACRGGAALVHAACLARSARARAADDPRHEAWETCATCTVPFTGRARDALARARDALLTPTQLVVDTDRAIREGRLEAVEPALRAAYAASSGDERLAAQSALGSCALARGAVDEALALQRDVLQRATAIHGAAHRRAFVAAVRLGNTLLAARRSDEAVAVYRDAATALERAGRRDTPDHMAASANLGVALWSAGAVDEARATFDATAERMRRVLGPEHPDTLLLAAKRVVCSVHGSGAAVDREELGRIAATLARTVPETDPVLAALRGAA